MKETPKKYTKKACGLHADRRGSSKPSLSQGGYDFLVMPLSLDEGLQVQKDCAEPETLDRHLPVKWLIRYSIGLAQGSIFTSSFALNSSGSYSRALSRTC